MKTLAWIILLLTIQRRLCSKFVQEDEGVLDHSNIEDREHVNEWVVHIPKGKPNSLHNSTFEWGQKLYYNFSAY